MTPSHTVPLKTTTHENVLGVLAGARSQQGLHHREVAIDAGHAEGRVAFLRTGSEQQHHPHLPHAHNELFLILCQYPRHPPLLPWPPCRHPHPTGPAPLHGGP